MLCSLSFLCLSVNDHIQVVALKTGLLSCGPHTHSPLIESSIGANSQKTFGQCTNAFD